MSKRPLAAPFALCDAETGTDAKETNSPVGRNSMKLSISMAAAAVLVLMTLGASQIVAQDKFTLGFPFKAASLKLPKGDYTIVYRKGDTQLTLRQESSGKEFQVSSGERSLWMTKTPPLLSPASGLECLKTFPSGESTTFTCFSSALGRTSS